MPSDAALAARTTGSSADAVSAFSCAAPWGARATGRSAALAANSGTRRRDEKLRRLGSRVVRVNASLVTQALRRRSPWYG